MEATCKIGSNGCFSDGKCRYKRDCEYKVVTNADRIRAMSDQELAGVIMCPMEFNGIKDLCAKNPGHTCVECSLKWLQEPVEEEPNGK